MPWPLGLPLKISSGATIERASLNRVDVGVKNVSECSAAGTAPPRPANVLPDDCGIPIPSFQRLMALLPPIDMVISTICNGV